MNEAVKRLVRAELAKPDAPAAAPDGWVPVGELEFARHEIADWALYASPYFQEKHDLKGTLARVDAAISAAAPRPAPAKPLTDEQVFTSEDFMTANGLYWGLPMTTLIQIVRAQSAPTASGARNE